MVVGCRKNPDVLLRNEFRKLAQGMHSVKRMRKVGDGLKKGNRLWELNSKRLLYQSEAPTATPCV